MPAARRWAPLTVTLVAALAMVAAILAYVLIDDSAPDKGARAFTSDESAAVAAAQTGAANLASFRRAHFAADFQRALNSVTGQLKTDVANKRATTLKSLTDGKFDLTARVTNTALVGRVDNDKVDGYVVLVSFAGARSTQLNLPTQQNLSVTVVKTKGKWLVSDLTAVGVS